VRQPVSASYVVGVIRRYPSERLAILSLLYTSRGHRFARRVLALLRTSCVPTDNVAARDARDAATSGVDHAL
jgi:hypothetical protein